jgi:outer membrane protein assembly factor BamB
VTRVQDADGMPELADLGHVSATILPSSSGTLLIVRQLCSDTRFTSQSNRGLYWPSLTRRNRKRQDIREEKMDAIASDGDVAGGKQQFRRALLKIVGLALTGPFLLWSLSVALAIEPQFPTNVTTYHYDNQRTGWNSNERILTPANVGSSTFGLLHSVFLDDPYDQVDAQPMIVANQLIRHKGIRNVAYVATETNRIYAIDTDTGEILLRPKLAEPVPQSALPGNCNNNLAYVGINSTPVIDLGSGTMYVVVYSYETPIPSSVANPTAVYRLHALRLDDLTDKPPPAIVTASHQLVDGTMYAFNATNQRQRSALLLANGNVYAAFASFCDIHSNDSRGWLLGWEAGSLKPLNANELTDKERRGQASLHGSNIPDQFFLSSIWMSGYGVAADSSDDLYFVTGNSNGVQVNYNTNIQESAVKLSPDLTAVIDYFTPFDFATLDEKDNDFGSGGLLVLPDQPGGRHFAVAAGKDGRLFFMDRDNMGQFVPNGPDVPQNVDIGRCWCGQSYFEGSDGIGRVVTSGGFQVKVWKVLSAGSRPPLALERSYIQIADDSLHDPGFFTTVSSHGFQDAIIWAVARPRSAFGLGFILAAFDPSQNSPRPLFIGSPGIWPNNYANPNIVPMVANGQIYIASYRELSIYGIGAEGGGAQIAQEASLEIPVASPPASLTGSVVWGTIESIDRDRLVLQLRTGRMFRIDLADAVRAHLTVVPYVGEGVMVKGTLDERDTLHAQVMLRDDHPATWGPDQLVRPEGPD